jgi:hypothetical protein
MRAFPRAIGALSYVCLLAVPAAATTYQKVDDPDLADQASVIVEARVIGAPKPAAGRIPSTDYPFVVERALRGASVGDPLTVRVPGGSRPDGLSLRIWGAPRFAPEERALLFLAPNDDGSYHVLHLMLGAFHEIAADGRKMAARDLSEAREVAGEDAEPPRDLERFRAWLADRVAGSHRAPDYFLAGSLPPGIQEKFNLLTANGARERWFVFDEGGSVAWAANSSGQPGVPGGGFAEFQRALAAWNAEPTTPIHYAWAGQTNATGGLGRYDGVNAILFDEPVGEPFDCDRGGVLAIGGPWFDTRRQAAWGTGSFVQITGADIVTNAGIGCYLARSANPSKAAEEIFGHELGHTLGLGHSCGDTGSGACAGKPAADDALMRAYLHDDGRGARLAADDRAALQSLYRPGASQAAAAPPAVPTDLIAETAGLTANLLWEDRSADEEGFRVYRRTGDGALARIAELPAGATVYSDSGLKPGTRYEYQVSAFNARGESRGPRAALVLPASQPLQALSLTSRTVTARTGEPVDFSVSFSGPARRAQWDFPGGMELSDAPCDPRSFCATHIFSRPGDWAVKVHLLGDFGQTSERKIQIHVEGPEITPADGGTFLASVVPGGDLWLAGDGSSATLARVTFQPLAAGSAPVNRDLTLAPGATLLVPDVLKTLFGATAQGSLALAYSGPAVHAFSRARSGPFTGEEPEAGWSSEEKVLAGLPCVDGSVSTLLVNNLDAEPGQATVGLLDGMGQPVGNPAVLDLGPRSARSQRLDRLFPEIGLHTGPFSARITSNGVRFTASATLAGGELRTPLLLQARAGAAGDELLIPRVSRGAGPFNTFQFSRLLAANPSDQPRELLCELWPRGQARRVATLTIPPGGSIMIEDVLRDLFGLGEVLGALKISWSGDGPAPRVLSLVVSTARGGTGDRFTAVVEGMATSSNPGRAVDFGAEPSTFTRSNWGAVNPGDAPATLRLSLRNPAGEVVRTAQVTLRPRQSFERTLAGIFPQATSGRWTVASEVLAGGPVQSYLFQTGAGGDVSFVSGSTE